MKAVIIIIYTSSEYDLFVSHLLQKITGKYANQIIFTLSYKTVENIEFVSQRYF